MPQIPAQAYSLAETKIKELTAKQSANTKQIAKLTKKIRRDILAIHEEAQVAKDVLETLRKPGGTKNFAVIQGFIPSKMEEKFKNSTKQWMSVSEDIVDPKLKEQIPILFDNPRFVRTFEVITESQGIPGKGEADPTPMIALMWPIFYGLNVCRFRSRFAINGNGIIIQIKRTRYTFKMGNVNCNFRSFCSYCGCWSG